MSKLKLTELTPAQAALMVAYRDKWMRIGLCTERADRPKAEDALRRAYQIAGLTPPDQILWTTSPLAGALIVSILKDDKLMKKIAKELGAKRPQKLGDSVGDSVWDSVRDSVGDSVGASVWASVWYSVWDSVGASVGDSGYGQHDANWLAFYDFFKEVCKLDAQTNKFSGLWKVSKNAGWYLPHQNICWVSERHNYLSRNNEGRLHSDTKMALSYPDRWGIYALNGVRFPEDLWKKVTSREMTFDDILKIVDIDQRTQAMKYCKEGAREFYTRIGGKVIDKVTKLDVNAEPVNYELWELPKGDIFTKNVHYVIYNCPSTGKEYTKGVPEFKTVAEALSWGMSDEVSILSPEQWSRLVPLSDES